MGLALASSLARAHPDAAIAVADPQCSQLERFNDLANVRTTTDNLEAAKSVDALLLAVKPQMLKPVVEELRELSIAALVISVAAGVTLETIARWFGGARPIVRCMPNTPALVSKGVAGAIGNAEVTDRHRQLADRLLRPGCEIVWLESDRDLDVVTAVSGSGPAYFFYLMEIMMESARRLGMPQELARTLVVRTATGAAAMAEQPGRTPSELRRQVTSPRGTTQAAIEALDLEHVRDTWSQAIDAAFERSKELGRELSCTG